MWCNQLILCMNLIFLYIFLYYKSKGQYNESLFTPRMFGAKAEPLLLHKSVVTFFFCLNKSHVKSAPNFHGECLCWCEQSLTVT